MTIALTTFFSSLLLTASAAVRPEAPGEERWTFRTEFAEAEPNPLPEVGIDPATGRKRTPWLKDRVSRCFFGPIKRPPNNRDELMDDVDYYPDAYLDRMRREGVNGLWLTIDLPELGERQYAKLRRTVEKCARHGIGVWIFGMEPRNRDARRHGPVCTSDPKNRAWLTDRFRDVFAAVPGLAGYIGITHGECTTSCLSTVQPWEDKPADCPLCGRLPNWRIHWNTLSAISKGVRAGNPEARTISWLYQPKLYPHRAPWVADCARHVPDGVTVMYNFESGLAVEQAGKVRHGGDYWLSQPGPGEPFKMVAAGSHEAGKPIWAKIQALCSHEDATVPYMPVPGLLYRKYKAMKDAGVTGAMLCWYFGNCPGVMNRAAGELAYEDFKDGERAFLLRLAKSVGWGSDAETMVALWEAFARSYAEYPVSNYMQYYGPFHFGVVWELLPMVSRRAPEPTWVTRFPQDWRTGFPPTGDFIGDMLADFTLDDTLVQCEKMVAELDGVDAKLDALSTRWSHDREKRRDLGVMRTVAAQFRSSRNIFAFYRARREALRLSRREGNAAAARAEVAKMRKVLADEKNISRALIPLCEDDSRLGFHSEAEAHQFFPARLEWRIERLAAAERELAAIDAELAAGRPYPESDAERDAPVWRKGSPVPPGATHLTLYDAAGTVFPRTLPLKDGRLPVELSGGDYILFHTADGTPVWPKGPRARARLWLLIRPESAGRISDD